MKTITLIFLLFFVKITFAVQSIDLAGQLPPNTTIFTGGSTNQFISTFVKIGYFNNDLEIDLAVTDFDSIFVFLGPINYGQIKTTANADFKLGQPVNSQYIVHEVADLNGDNFTDLIIYASYLNNVYIIFGGTNFTSLPAISNVGNVSDLVIKKNNFMDSSLGFGETIAVGNVNGDGFEDLLIGTSGGTYRAYLLLGKSVWQDTINFNQDSSDVLIYTGEFGTRDLFLKDFNEDGFDDIIIGNHSSDNGKGRVDIFYSYPNLPQVINYLDKNKTIIGPNDAFFFGFNVEVGNFTSAGSIDLIIAEGLQSNPFAPDNADNVYVFNSQNLQGDTVQVDLVAPTVKFNAEYGLDSWFRDFIFAKNINGDGFDDLVISDWFADELRGKGYIYLGGANQPSQIQLSNQSANFIVNGPNEDNGTNINDILDLNNDGFLDFIISIPGYDTPTANGAGAVMIVWGSAAGFDNDPIANAGEDLSGFVDSLVTLDGTSSYDIDGDSLSFLWTQISGTSVTLQTPTQPLCSFVNNGLVGEFLTFVLEISSNAFVSTDTVRVLVLPTNLSENTNKTKNFKLSQNFPNPFNPSTKISYEMPVSSGKLLIFNVKGEQVCEFLLSEKSGSVVWNGTDFSGKQVSSGVYFYRLETKTGFSETKKMVMLK